MLNSAIVFTHGDKHDFRINLDDLSEKIPMPNPGMTKKGFEDIEAIKTLAPANPSTFICGTGRRHLDVLSVLRPHDFTDGVFFTNVAGDCDSMVVIDGKKMAVLADGTVIPLGHHRSIADTSSAAKEMVMALEDNTVICAGRPFMIALGVKDAKSAAAYRILFDESGIKNIELVIAHGVIDPTLQK